jgi:ParB/RepB/Spo0J family partition protein
LMKVSDNETAERAAELDLPMLHLPLASIALDDHQLRRLPHPAELNHMAEHGDLAAIALLAGLRELGQSIQEQGQLQPAIVYADSNPDDPQITHRLLHGQRRWSAASLMNLPTLWVVVVEQPSPLQRVLRQYDENERREGLTDMERAWALKALKETLEAETGEGVSWSVIEHHMQLSEPRRKDLLRLLRFSDEGQHLILRYGWSEWTLRSLHKAIQANEIDQEGAMALLIALTKEEEVNAQVVANVVAGYLQQLATENHLPDDQPREVDVEDVFTRKGRDTTRRLSHTRRTIDQFRADLLEQVTDTEVRAAIRQEAHELQQSLNNLLAALE